MDTMNKGLTYALSYKDVVDIMKIIDESTCRELHLEIGDFKLDLVKGPPGVGSEVNSQGNAGTEAGTVNAAVAVQNVDTAPRKQAGLRQAVAAKQKVSRDTSSIEITTPLEGVFYCAPAPGAPPFVEVGCPVEAGDQVAIVEVMKLMNSIKAPRKGKIREIIVQNEALVKMGQVLMVLDPDPAATKK